MGKCSFNTAWLKDERYSKWLSVDRQNKHAAFCRVCERVFLLTTMGMKAVDSHMKSEEHRKSIATCDKKLSEESEFDTELRGSWRRQCYTGGSIVVENIRSTFSSTECLRCLKRNCCGHCKQWRSTNCICVL